MEGQPVLIEEIQKLGPEAKLRVARGLIKHFLEQNPDGVTAQAVTKAVGLSYTHVKKHLDYLVATRQIYVHEAGPRTFIYFPNARLSHPYDRLMFRLGDQTFRVNLIKNLKGEFAYFQEMRSSPAHGEQVAGGIIIRVEHLNEFIAKLQGFVNRQ